MNAIPFELAADVTGRVRIGQVQAAPVSVTAAGRDLQDETDRLAIALRERHGGCPPASIDGLRPARTLYKAFGIDPTKVRPSSEALLRRVLREQPLPRILNAVDLCNLLSLSFLLPLGLYDAAKVEGAVTLRTGQAGETYAGIRKQDVRLEGRPVLSDRCGPFGNPTSDSLRTSVDAQTSSLWLVIFAPADYSTDRLDAHVARASEAMARHLAPAGAPTRTAGALG